MPRMPRERSATGIYHIMLRGIDKREIFISEMDNDKFLRCIQNAMDFGRFKLLAYCLMKNHVHLLLEEMDESVSLSIKRITCSYVPWHNAKYARVGHLFQDRFRSEPVLTERYLLTVLRYIHQNPVKANMCKYPSDYKWSSYNSYINSYDNEEQFVSTSLFKDYFKTKEKFKTYMYEDNDDGCLEYEEYKRYSDDELAQIIKFRYKLNDLSLNRHNSIHLGLVSTIYLETGAAIRQLSRVLGVSKAIIEKAIKSPEQTIEGV